MRKQEKALPAYRQSQQVGETSSTGKHPQPFPDICFSVINIIYQQLSCSCPIDNKRVQFIFQPFLRSVYVFCVLSTAQHSRRFLNKPSQSLENAYFSSFKSLKSVTSIDFPADTVVLSKGSFSLSLFLPVISILAEILSLSIRMEILTGEKHGYLGILSFINSLEFNYE